MNTLILMLAAVVVPMTNGEFRATVDLGGGVRSDLRIPAARLAGKGVTNATLDFDGVFWRLEAAGECDEDSVCEPLDVPPEYVRTKPAPRSERRPLEGLPQYWRPHDWNATVGDVVTITFKGRLHVFYLYDRRHHASKGGAGGHFFAHLSTDDLVRWTEEPDAVPLTEWWQAVGTGTPFVKDGKLCLAYGFHTERLKAAKGKPVGATWAESEDGIHFRPTGRIFHTTRNPTVYNRPDGAFGMILGYNGLGGMYRSDDLITWTPVDTKIPANGDCPCYFEWNGHHYILQGFKHYCRSETGLPGSWRSCDEEGKSLYDTLRVPMVANWTGNRRFLIGWVSSPKGGWWGGWLVFRELKQRPDGSLYTQWIPELPNPGTVRVNGDGSRTAVYVDRDDPELVIEDTETPSGCRLVVRREKNLSYAQSTNK